MNATNPAPPDSRRLDVDGLLLDLDGVCYVGDEPVPGAREALERFATAGLPVRFVTNTTKRSLDEVAAGIARLGLPIAREQIVTAPRAALAWLRDRGLPRCRLVVSETLLAEFAEVPRDDETPEVVVLGDPGDIWTHELLQELFEQIMAGADLVALHKGRYWQTGAGLRLDIGAYVAGLEHATGKQARIMGKPSCDFFLQAVAALGLPAGVAGGRTRVAMVGDDVISDVAGAQTCGLKGVLVRTGKYREEAVRRSGVRPDLVVDSLADLPDLIA